LNTLSLQLSNLNYNYAQIQKQLNPSTEVVAVVKADAYGSASKAVAKRLEALGVDYLAVAYAEEGKMLRNYGIKIPIMVFYPQVGSLKILLEEALEPCLYSRSLLLAFKVLLKTRNNSQYPIHIKYNTGLQRIGFSPEDTNWVMAQTTSDYFNLKSVYSHLAASEDQRPSKLCDQQIMLFEKIKKVHSKNKTLPPKFHLLNSSGVFNYPELQYDMVRCGIALHGFANHPKWDALLKPIAVLESSISQIHNVKKGSFVGYDHGWKAPVDSKIATLPLGHADGIGRHFGHHKGSVLINGEQAFIVGNVCMDMLMVDVTKIKCKELDNVEFFGTTHNTAAVFSKQGQSISYEVLSGLGPRIKRVVKE
jgi:alanine racemase|tara:strand:- start:6718 stop:7809 length:1092 start_codon:yes stop_codon:yes gene_type:complete